MKRQVHLSHTFTVEELDDFRADLKTQSAFAAFVFKIIYDHLGDPDMAETLPQKTRILLESLLPRCATSNELAERIWAFLARFDGHVLDDKEPLQ